MLTLTMVFLNEQGNKVSLNISPVKDTVTAAEVKTLMDTIISKNIFTSTGGDLKTKHSAYTTAKTQNDLDVLV